MRYEPQKANDNIAEGTEPQPGSVEAIDPFSAPVPGQSLTVAPGSQKFEKPAEFTDPDECVALIIERLETDRAAKEEQLSLIASGVPVESIVNSIAFIGFSEGQWSPDVAELIKPPLAMYLMITAMSEDVPMVVFNPEKTSGGKMEPGDMARNMSKLNPAGYEALQEGANRAGVEEEMLSGGFLEPVQEVMPDEMVEVPVEEGLSNEELMADMPEGGML